MEKQIRGVATFLIVASVGVGILIASNILSWLIPVCITDPAQWAQGYPNPEAVHPTKLARFLIFALWMSYIGFIFYIISIGIHLLLAYRNGAYFETRTYRLIFRFGAAMTLSVGVYIGVRILDFLIFKSTIDGPLHSGSWQHYIYPDIIIIALCGLFICVIGWVMKIASAINEDHEAIV